MVSDNPLIPHDEIGKRIFLIRGRRVMLDSDLAAMYGVSTRRLNEQVRRNATRFPDDFMFRLTQEEFAALMSQNATSKIGSGGRRKLPLVFTQEGVAMLSGVLKSLRAITVNIAIMRAFVRLKRMAEVNSEMAAQLAEIERRVEGHDKNIRKAFAAIRRLMQLSSEPPPEPPRPPIGFRT